MAMRSVSLLAGSVATAAALLLTQIPGGAPAALDHQGHLAVAQTASADTLGFVSAFSGKPAAPQAWSSADWDVTVHTRDDGPYGKVEPVVAQHGSDCGAAPATHLVQTSDDAVFLCNNHVMTALNATGYGVIYLTPNQVLDFSPAAVGPEGEARVQFSASTARTSLRDWIDLWVTPYEDHLQLPLDHDLPDLHGEPKNGLHVRMDAFYPQNQASQTVFKGFLSRNFAVEALPGNTWTGYESVLSPSPVTRSTFELRISRTHVKFGLPEQNLWWIDTSVADLGWDHAVIQLGHHSYNPNKECQPSLLAQHLKAVGTTTCRPDTWHWSDVQLTPATSFALLHGSRREVSATTASQPVAFTAAAPAGSRLQFDAVGSNMEVSADGGATWQRAQKQATGPQDTRGDDHFISYWTPVPAGTRNVLLRANDWWGGPWLARDISIWGPPASGAAANSPSAATAPTAKTEVAGVQAIGGVEVAGVQVSGDAAPAETATAPAAGNRVPWLGSSWYWQGVNVAWLNWGHDFGGGSVDGVSSASSQALLNPAFSRLKNDNVHVVRWWMFEGDAAQITRDASGAPSGINPAVYTDIDAALKLADQYDLYYDFVLFSGAANAIPQSWMTDPAQRAKLVQVLTPLFARYKDNPRVMTWEVFNEPEWDIWQNKVAQAPVQATVREIATAVHTSSNAYVTVGSAILDGLKMWVGQGLDYYQAHWYDPMSSGEWCARCTDYATVKARYNLDAPVVIGELYAGPDVDAQQRFTDFYNKGFAGAWAWSLFPDRTADKLAINQDAARAFVGQHTDSAPSAGLTQAPVAPAVKAAALQPVPETASPSASAQPVAATTLAGVPPSEVATTNEAAELIAQGAEIAVTTEA